ncbi:MAG: carbohydrate binding family 9 domain-containing protein, partial [Gemmatimonadetes bacterium]|nr:carbohydrate binding family 9 domain-containing protein [Gemmatimonadota bacterium]
MTGRVVLRIGVCTGLTLMAASGALGQTTSNTGDTSRAGSPPKQAIAVSIDSDLITVDGRLDDAAWREAHYFADFLQKEPEQGAAPTERTEIAFVYDGGALYVGARMLHQDPSNIARVMTRRDEMGNVETLAVSLDTYLDRRTSYSFAITAAGVRIDWYNPADTEHRRDFTYNPVWEARVQQDSLGWTAEMRIPFSQLRFNETGQWGFNVNRWIPSKNEDLYWVSIPRDEAGWASRFGDLTGIEDVESSRRMELMPYVASDTRVSSRELVDDDDPFAGQTQFDGRIGADFKMGLGSSLTLDATVNPDFGQVEADPAVVNLSAFEVTFDERRPFFVEGAQMLGGGGENGGRMGPQFYYSRRIGASPHGWPDAEFVDRPDATTIVGATKVTGRLASGLSVGVLGALTSAEHARTYDSGLDRFEDVGVEPMVGWGVLRLQQEVGESGSTIGLTATGVKRHFGNDTEILRYEMNEQAFTGGGDFLVKLSGNRYEVSGHIGLSYVGGDSSAIANVQTASAHYFQRPDQDHVTFDPERTSLFGTSASVQARKIEGEHWLWEAGVWGDSPNFELNDVGVIRQADDIATWGNVTYRETVPGRVFRSYSLTANTMNGFNFGGVHKQARFNLFAGSQLWNYWRTNLRFAYNAPVQNDRLTRGGPLMGQPAWGSINARLANNFTSSTRWDVSFMWGNLNQGNDWFLDFGIGFEPSDRFAFRVAPGVSWMTNRRQYYTVLDRDTDRTYGERYIFSTVDQKTVSMQLRANYSFTPDLNLEFYAEPFAASGKFSRFGELPEARSFDLREYGTDGT